MCRSIKTLRSGATIAGQEDIEAAALQFVRKISGFHRPAARHQAAFDTAVRDITAASERFMQELSATLSANGRTS